MQTIDTLRAFWGPLPMIMCKVSYFTAHVVVNSASLFCTAIACTKFTFVCVFKAIPYMQDDIIMRFLFVLTYLLSTLMMLTDLYLPGREELYQVSKWLIPLSALQNTFLKLICNGKYYHEWVDQEQKTKGFAYFVTLCLMIHMCLSAAVSIKKMIWKTEEQKKFGFRGTGTKFRGILVTRVALILIMIGAYTAKKIGDTPPPSLRIYPHKIYFTIVQAAIPAALSSSVSFLMIQRSKSLQTIIKSKFMWVIKRNYCKVYSGTPENYDV